MRIRGYGAGLAAVAFLVAPLPAGQPAPPADPNARLGPIDTRPLDEPLAVEVYRRQVEADWLRQLEGPRPAGGKVTTAQDAAGAVDGVKDGKYAFHTGLEPNPWWQVDLGQSVEIARIVVYNRLDYAPGLHNADDLVILAGEDGKTWRQVHDNQGRHFGGVSGAKPLDVAFGPSKLKARFLRLQVPSTKPVFFHLDEVEVYGAADPKRNIALGHPADQSSISQWSTAKATAPPEATAAAMTVYPTQAVLDRGAAMAAELRRLGLDTRPHEREMADLARRLAAQDAAAGAEARKQLYLQARWAIRRLAFANPLLRFDRLIFVKRFTQETYPDVCLNHMPWVSRPGGDICILSAPPGGEGLFAALADPPPGKAGLALRSILNGALGHGHVHGMDLWFDADRVVFGYARSRGPEPPPGWTDRASNYRLRRTEEPIHIFEVGIDGRGLRQLTAGQWSDLDPACLPNGNICFVSERCGYSLQCNELDKDETSTNLYVMRPDGSGIRRLSVTKDGDYLPHTLDDGQIAYTRWEYQERGWANIQSIWTIRPDGTWADALFKQHMNEPWALEDTRSIPGSRKLVAIATGHHTLAMGPLCAIDPSGGMNDPSGISIITPDIRPPEGGMAGRPVPEGGVRDAGGLYTTPWALSERFFLACYSFSDRQTEPAGFAIYLVDVFGNKELVYRDERISCFTPIPLRPRPRPPILPELIDPNQDSATCIVSDVGSGVEGVDPARIKYIRIARRLPWPYDNTHGGWRYETDAKGRGLNWTPAQVLGTVPVEPDGSACFRVPADRSVYFQLLDANHMELRRMRSFISFQGGEVRACMGCHESRAMTGQAARPPLAAQRRPASLTPAPWGQRPVSFLRDIQPVLDRHCVRCHAGLKPAGGLDFSPGLTALHNRAYDTIVAAKLISCANKMDDARITPPLAFGSHRSKLVAVLAAPAHRQRATLSEADRIRLVTWIDLNAPYHDRFIDKRPAVPPYDLAGDGGLAQQLAAVHQRRCAGCHKGLDVSRLDWIDLSDPARSLFLTAPLAKPAGGMGRCRRAAATAPVGAGGAEGPAVYADRADADYQAVLKAVREAVERAWAAPRRDLAALAEAIRSASASNACDSHRSSFPNAHGDGLRRPG